MTKTCDICGTEFETRFPFQKRCSPECSQKHNKEYINQYMAAYYHANKTKAQQRYRINQGKGKFRCPHCGEWHNTPRDIKGDKRQYCYPCRNNWDVLGWPADEHDHEHSIGIY